MQPVLQWAERARRDLLDIYVAIGLEQPAAAERYFDRIESKVALLVTQPRMGVSRADIRPGLRMLIETPYVVLYRIEPDDEEQPVLIIDIVRIVDGRRELSKLF